MKTLKLLAWMLAPLFAVLAPVAATADDDMLISRTTDDGVIEVVYNWDKPAVVYSNNNQLKAGAAFYPHTQICYLQPEGRSKGKIYTVDGGIIVKYDLKGAQSINKGDVLYSYDPAVVTHDSAVAGGNRKEEVGSWTELFKGLGKNTGIYDLVQQTKADFNKTWLLGLGKVLMICIALLLLYLAIIKGFEPLLLLPIGFGALLANIPIIGISTPGGLLYMTYNVGIESGLFPLLIFMGVGAMTDFGPLLANPKMAILGGAAQLGIFGALIGAVLLGIAGLGFDLRDAASIGIIGGADGPTSIYLTSRLSPPLLGAVAVAAYSYMALVPIIQPPIMKLFTTKAERKIKMKQLRSVSKLEKVCFPILITLMCAFLLPDAAPLIGMLMLGNLMRECGCVDRLSDTAQNALCNIVTIFLGLSVGSKLSADQFLSLQTLGILLLGAIAFSMGTAGGVLMAKLFNVFSKEKINPLIGAAGVSAVPMAARVVNKVGLESDPHNFLLMHAMGPNVSGVIGSAVAAGVLLQALS